MPWTFAHPAAVLPLRRWCPARLNLAALVLGTLTPDIGYYVGSFRLPSLAHSFRGSLLVCLPVGVGCLVLFYLLRRPVWYLLPRHHRALLEPLLTSPVPSSLMPVLGALISVVIGAWTHILWDSFTHESGWVVDRVVLLQEPIKQLPVYRFLQHLSTAVGIGVLVVSYRVWMFRQGVTPARPARDDLWRYALLAAMSLASLAIALAFAIPEVLTAPARLAWQVFVFYMATRSVASLVPMLILASLLCYGLRKETPVDRPDLPTGAGGA